MSTGKVRSLPSKINSKFILLIFQVHFILDFVNFDQDCCLFKFILFLLLLNLKNQDKVGSEFTSGRHALLSKKTNYQTWNNIDIALWQIEMMYAQVV